MSGAPTPEADRSRPRSSRARARLAEEAGAILMDALGPFEEEQAPAAGRPDEAGGAQERVVLVFYPPADGPIHPRRAAGAPARGLRRRRACCRSRPASVSRDWVEGWRDAFPADSHRAGAHPPAVGGAALAAGRAAWPVPGAAERPCSSTWSSTPGWGSAPVCIPPPGAPCGCSRKAWLRGRRRGAARPAAPGGSAALGPLVDAGTGSGILAIAAAKLGWGPVIALDNDPVALMSARENVDENGVADQVEIHEADIEQRPGGLVRRRDRACQHDARTGLAAPDSGWPRWPARPRPPGRLGHPGRQPGGTDHARRRTSPGSPPAAGCTKGSGSASSCCRDRVRDPRGRVMARHTKGRSRSDRRRATLVRAGLIPAGDPTGRSSAIAGVIVRRGKSLEVEPLFQPGPPLPVERGAGQAAARAISCSSPSPTGFKAQHRPPTRQERRAQGRHGGPARRQRHPQRGFSPSGAGRRGRRPPTAARSARRRPGRSARSLHLHRRSGDGPGFRRRPLLRAHARRAPPRSTCTSPTSPTSCGKARPSTGRRCAAATRCTWPPAWSPCCRRCSRRASARCGPDEDRKTVTVEMEVDDAGKVLRQPLLPLAHPQRQPPGLRAGGADVPRGRADRTPSWREPLAWGQDAGPDAARDPARSAGSLQIESTEPEFEWDEDGEVVARRSQRGAGEPLVHRELHGAGQRAGGLVPGAGAGPHGLPGARSARSVPRGPPARRALQPGSAHPALRPADGHPAGHPPGDAGDGGVGRPAHAAGRGQGGAGPAGAAGAVPGGLRHGEHRPLRAGLARPTATSRRPSAATPTCWCTGACSARLGLGAGADDRLPGRLGRALLARPSARPPRSN